MLPWLSADTPFPPVAQALVEPNGLLAAGGDLCAGRLLAAYRLGIYPWYGDGQPILWWSPDPRMVLEVAAFKVARSLRKRIRHGGFEIRSDTAFRAVVERCASTRRIGQPGTWITKPMIEAYDDLHTRGYTHSVETWHDGELVGGLYGMALDRVFFGESMFSTRSDASKVALAGLIDLLRARDVRLVDCQQETRHLASVGARVVPRAQFVAELDRLILSMAPPRDWPRGPLGGAA